jgi:serine O-acetyltransferase
MNRRITGRMTLAPKSEPSQAVAAESGSSVVLWARLRLEAEKAVGSERALGPLLVNSILNRSTFEDAVIHRVAARLGNESVPAAPISDAFAQAIADDPAIAAGFRRDLLAALECNLACGRLLQAFLYFNGFHALQTHRLAHWLWRGGRRDFARYLRSRSSDLFQTDIDPAARLGAGIFLKRATGFVVGSTAVIDDDVSILQNVTLGGAGRKGADRHPKIRRGAMIGAGAKILGNIEIGSGARIAAGSLVLHPVAPNATVAGVPARPVGPAADSEPADGANLTPGWLACDSFACSI